MGQDWPCDLQGLYSVSDISDIKSFQRRRAAATPLPPINSRQKSCTDFVFEVSPFTEEATGSRKEMLSEGDTRDLDDIPASAGDSLCS